jgi:hypothetical protein
VVESIAGIKPRVSPNEKEVEYLAPNTPARRRLLQACLRQ